MRPSLRLLVVLLAFTVAPLSARMTPLVWTLSGVTFTDGGTASGSFVYDATTNTYSGINITTTTGAIRTGASYGVVTFSLDPVTASSFFALTSSAPDQTGLPLMALSFTTPLTNAGGTATILASNSGEASCGNAGCTTDVNPTRFMSGGSVTTNAVPAMPFWNFLVTGLAIGLGAVWVLRGRPRVAPAR